MAKEEKAQKVTRRAAWVGGQLSIKGPVSRVVDPWSGQVVTEVNGVDAGLLETAIGEARRANDITRKLAPFERAAMLDTVAAGLHRKFDAFVDVIVAEAGKPVRFAEGEVSRAIETFRAAAREVRAGLERSVPMGAVTAGKGRTGIVRRVAKGPIAAITPFNFPLNLVAHKLAPAMAAGCSFLAKPAPQTPSAALMLGELIVDSGYPPGAVNVVPCENEIAEQLVVDDRIAVLSFTGSEIGWDLKARAGRKTVLLEMGGNAAAIVEPDADLAYAAQRLALGAYAYAGQVCVSVQRVFIHADVYDEFVALFREQVERHIPYGDPRQPGTIVGPMINVNAFHRVLDWIDEAEELGARLAAPSGPEAPVIPPVVLEAVPQGLPIMDEEVFGPVACLQKTSGFEESIFEANRSRFGLQAGVFTHDIRKIAQAWEELEVGAVLHDEYPTYRVDHMPYGGVKASGFGREGLRESIDAYTEPRLLVLRGRP